jgi:hypothetical protein
MAEPAEDAGAGAAAAQEDFDFPSAFGRLRSKPCAVSRITLVGNRRTKDHIVLRELPVRRPRARRRGGCAARGAEAVLRRRSWRPLRRCSRRARWRRSRTA